MIVVNLFDLHEEIDNAHPKGQIKASCSPELVKSFIDVLNEIQQTRRLKLKDIASMIGVSYVDLWEFQKGRSIPLCVLRNLSTLASKITDKSAAEFSAVLQSKIRYLEYGAGPNKRVCKAVKSIDEDLSKIAGAHAADGHLKRRETFRKGRKIPRYEFVIRDEYFGNLKVFAKWMESTFGVEVKIKKENRHKGWYIYLGNKILFRYLNRVLGFPSGKKFDCVKVPTAITNSSLDIQLSFCLGAFTFDGCVNYRTGYVDFSTKSHELFTGINRILDAVGIWPDFVSKQADRFSRWIIRFRKYKNLKKCLALFEPTTEKWWRLKDHIFGPSGNAHDTEELFKKFDYAYPKTKPNAATFSDVIRVVQKFKKTTSKEASSHLERGYTTAHEFLKKLEDWGILCSENEFQDTCRRVWRLNENCKEWKVPTRNTKLNFK